MRRSIFMGTGLLLGACLLLVILHFCYTSTIGQPHPEDDGELVFTSILYRHGDRTPDKSYANDPYKNRSYWPIGWGMLTDAGKKRHFQLGQWLRMRYLSLITDGKYSHDLIAIFSTDWDRTLMSAQSNLAGFFLPTEEEMWCDIKWQPIPVHTVPRKLDKLLGTSYPCPKYDEEFAVVNESPEVMAYMEQHLQLFKYISEKSGELVDNPQKTLLLANTLEIQENNNYTLPNWTKSVFPDEINSVGIYGLQMMSMTKTLKRLFGGRILKDIVTHMKQKRDGTLSPDRNIWVYSAHDTTVAALLNAMGVFEPHLPPFAATVMVDLRKNKLEEFSVSVYYKNSTEPTLLTIPGCTPSCPLDMFESLLADVIPEDWDKECLDASTTSKKYSINEAFGATTKL